MHAFLLALHRLPDLAILAIVILVVVALAMAAPFVGQFVLRRTASKATDDAAYDAYKAITAMIGVVLAFSLVQVNGNLRSAETVVGREAVALAAVDRVLLRMGIDQAAAIRPLLAAYGRSRIDDEWPDMAHGDRDPATDARYTDLSKAIRLLQPADMRQQAMFNELLKSVDDLAEMREMLILDSEIALPDFFWVTTVGLLLLGLVLAGLTAPTLARVVSLGAAATAVALLLAFVIIVDQPFEGQTSVSPAPLEKTLVLNSRRI